MFQFDEQLKTALGAECARIGQLIAAATQEDITIPDRVHGPIAELSDRFGLTLFERDILTFAIAVEINADIAALSAQVSGASRATFASFGVAFNVFENPNWQAVSPARPLRRLRLVELTLPERLLVSEIRVDERILHALFGSGTLDSRLRPYLKQLPEQPRPSKSLAGSVRKISAFFRKQDHRAMVISGRHTSDIRLAVKAMSSCQEMWRLNPADLPAAAPERETFARLWEREAKLNGAVLLIEAEGESEREHIDHILEGQPGPVIVAGQEPPKPQAALHNLEIPAPSRAEQSRLWRRTLGYQGRRMVSEIDSLTQTFDLGEAEIAALGEQIRDNRRFSVADLWHACRSSARPRLGNLAQRIDTLATWDDLILPEEAHSTLKVLVAQIRQRHRVYQDWGFAAKSNRGLGTTALFAGPSGTGKTMAAEVIAEHLELDLYRIDLSAVVSKYIGETEKNLRALFDAAEGTGAVLLFDEADALFGKRSEVSDAHDRYANIEVSYLLQRMEAYAGLAILTTNMRSALDDAFLRRIRFAVTFPFPNNSARLQIWKGVFPPDTQLSELAWEKLARLEVSAGHIRNIALNAAFLAADNCEPIAMEHLLQSTIIECANIEKPVTPTEIAGWLS